MGEKDCTEGLTWLFRLRLLQKQREEAKKEAVECTAKLDEATRQLSAKDDELKAVLKREEKTKAELEEVKSHSEKLQESVNHYGDVEARLNEAKIQLDDKQLKIKELQEEMARLKAKLEQEEGEWADKLKNAELAQKGQHEQVNKQLQAKLDKAKADLAKEKSLNGECQNDLRSKSMTLQATHKELKDLDQANQTLRRDVKEKEASLKRSEDKFNEYVAQDKVKRKEMETHAANKDTAFEALAERHEKGTTVREAERTLLKR